MPRELIVAPDNPPDSISDSNKSRFERSIQDVNEALAIEPYNPTVILGAFRTLKLMSTLPGLDQPATNWQMGRIHTLAGIHAEKHGSIFAADRHYADALRYHPTVKDIKHWITSNTKENANIPNKLVAFLRNHYEIKFLAEDSSDVDSRGFEPLASSM